MSKIDLEACATVWDFDAHFTDADIPMIKRCLEAMPLFVSPTVARYAKLKGFVEGVHFHVQKRIATC